METAGPGRTLVSRLAVGHGVKWPMHSIISGALAKPSPTHSIAIAWHGGRAIDPQGIGPGCLQRAAHADSWGASA